MSIQKIIFKDKCKECGENITGTYQTSNLIDFVKDISATLKSENNKFNGDFKINGEMILRKPITFICSKCQSKKDKKSRRLKCQKNL